MKPGGSIHPTRREILQSAAALAAAPAETSHWKPKLGIYCRYSPANVVFAGREGFNCVQLTVGGALSVDASDEQLAEVRRSLTAAGLTLVALGTPGNHFDPKFQQRFVKSIELAGRLGVPFVGTSSGAVAGQPLSSQVQAIVKLYESLMKHCSCAT